MSRVIHTSSGDQFIIDDEAALLAESKWYSCKTHAQTPHAIRHVWCDGKRTTEQLHRVIMGLKRGDNRQVDHINRDARDNRKVNLRIVTSKQNSRNLSTYSNNTSGFPGVHYRKPWAAFITLDQKRIHLGFFDSFEEAKAARLEGETKYFGVYAPQRISELV